VRAVALISALAVLSTALDGNGAPGSRDLLAIFMVAIALDIVTKERALARLPSARGPKELDGLRKRLPSYGVGLGVIYAAAAIGALHVLRGHGTPFSVVLIVTFVAAGLLMQFRVKPTMDRAWDRLRELDSKGVS